MVLARVYLQIRRAKVIVTKDEGERDFASEDGAVFRGDVEEVVGIRDEGLKTVCKGSP